MLSTEESKRECSICDSESSEDDDSEWGVKKGVYKKKKIKKLKKVSQKSGGIKKEKKPFTTNQS